MIYCMTTQDNNTVSKTRWISLKEVKEGYFGQRNVEFYKVLDRKGNLLIVGRNTEITKLGIVVYWKSNDRQVGNKHHKSRPKLYYAINTTERSNFKKTCRIQRWDINEFEEIEVETKSNTGHKRYLYALKCLYYKEW